jgi:hypothetical protein
MILAYFSISRVMCAASTAHRLRAFALEEIFHVLMLQAFHRLGVQLLDDRRRCAGGRPQRKPVVDVEAGIIRIHRRQIRQHRRFALGGHRQAAQFAAGDMRAAAGHRGHADIGFAAHRGDHRAARALVRHVRKFHAGELLQVFTAEMAGGAGAVGTKRHHFLTRFRQFDQFGQRAYRHRGMHHDHDRRRGHLRDRRQIALQVKRHFRKQGDVHRKRRGGHQQRVAVGRGFDHLFGADQSRAAAAGFHHRNLPPRRVKACTQQPRQYVGGATRQKWHDDAHLPRGIRRLCVRRGHRAARGDGQQRGCDR